MPPELTPGAQFYVAAFWELMTDRQLGMSAGPIPFTAIDAYAWRAGVHGDDFVYFSRMIRAMEQAASGQKGKPAAPQGRPLTPELFDAVFG